MDQVLGGARRDAGDLRVDLRIPAAPLGGATGRVWHQDARECAGIRPEHAAADLAPCRNGGRVFKTRLARRSTARLPPGTAHPLNRLWPPLAFGRQES